MPDWQGLSRVSAKGLSHHTTWPFRLNMPRIGSGAFCMPSRGSMSETQPLPGPNIVPFQKNRPANSELPRMIFKGGEFQNSFSFHSLDLIYCICAICCTVWFAAFWGVTLLVTLVHEHICVLIKAPWCQKGWGGVLLGSQQERRCLRYTLSGAFASTEWCWVGAYGWGWGEVLCLCLP